MDKSQLLNRALSERRCSLAHDLHNGLGIIAEHCELIADNAEPDSECSRRLRLILEVVQRLAKRINGHDCRLVGVSNPGPSKAPVGEVKH